MSVLGILSQLAEIGLTEAKIAEAVAESPEVRAEVIRTAEKAKQMWQEIWDAEGPHPYQSGAYRESFTVTYEERRGHFSATVRTRRPDALYLEYGTVKMKEFAPAQRTIDALNGEQSGATSKKQGGGQVGSIGG